MTTKKKTVSLSLKSYGNEKESRGFQNKNNTMCRQNRVDSDDPREGTV